MTKNRVEGFSDGVFSIVITLMAFDIKLSSSSVNLSEALIALHPKLKGYLLSFVMVGVYWMVHHNIFQVLRRVNRPFMWLNLMFLLAVTFLPFSTSLVGAYSTSQTAVLIYAANLSATSLVLFAAWSYATLNDRLTGTRIPPEVRNTVGHRLLGIPVLAVLSVAISFFSVKYSLYVYYSIVIPFFLARRMDRELMKFSPPDDMNT